MEDLANWRWTKNRFALTVRKRPSQRVFFEGVQFRSSEVAELMPAKSRKGIGGRQMRTKDWVQIGAALIALAHDGYFRTAEVDDKSAPRFKNKSNFVEMLLSHSGEALNRSHVFDVLGPLYDAFYPETGELNSRTMRSEGF